MTNTRKLNQLPAASSVKAADLVYTVDLTLGTANQSQKATAQQFADFVKAQVDGFELFDEETVSPSLVGINKKAGSVPLITISSNGGIIIGSRTGKTTGSSNGAILGGGSGNEATGASSVVGGGVSNTASASNSGVFGGDNNTATGGRGVVIGGSLNAVSSNSGAILGGGENIVAANGSVVLGGAQNEIENTGSGGAILGGTENKVTGANGIVAGGDKNKAVGLDSGAFGGTLNESEGQNSIVAGGDENKAVGENSIVAGGTLNEAKGVSSGILVGASNVIDAPGAVILGGNANEILINGIGGAILGGDNNKVTAARSVVLGGSNLVANVEDAAFAQRLHITEYAQLPVFADDTARDAAITVPSDGMLVFTDERAQIFSDTDWRSLAHLDDVFNQGSVQVVRSKEDFGTPDIDDVYTLEEGVTYLVVDEVDLDGGRLYCPERTSIQGFASETCSLTSTGLDLFDYLLTIEADFSLKNLKIFDVERALLINEPTALIDIQGCSFSNIPYLAQVDDSARIRIFLCQGVEVSGFVVDSATTRLVVRSGLWQIKDDSGAIGFKIDKAVLVLFSANQFIVPSGTTGISADGDSGNLPGLETYVIEGNRFAGVGTPANGILKSDNRARWTENVGLANSAKVGGLLLTGNATQTTVLQSTKAQAAGTTTLAAFSERFDRDATNNTLLHTSTKTSLIEFTVSLRCTAGNNDIVNFWVARKPASAGSLEPSSDYIPDSLGTVTTSGTRPDSIFLKAVISLDPNDEIYLVGENTSSPNFTVTDFNILAKTIPAAL
jgi:hypothetical protein